MSIPQHTAWDNEYNDPQFLTNSYEPQQDVRNFAKWYKKNFKRNFLGLKILDLGSGTGKNSFYFAQKGCQVFGIEISTAALKLAENKKIELQNLGETNLPKFTHGSVGEKLPFADQCFDIILDVLTSNSLSKIEHNMLVTEIKRVLKPNGILFVKTLCKEDDRNAKKLLLKFPAQEKDAYVLPETGISERVFDKQSLLQAYKNFEVLKLEQKVSYTKFKGKPFKRHFWNIKMRALSNCLKDATHQ